MGFDDLIALTQKQFQKQFNKSETEIHSVADEKPPTGILVDNPLLEFVLDRRFLAYGRCYLIYGKKGCSKTTLFYDFAKLFQRNGGDVLMLETENAVDLEYAKKQGVNLDGDRFKIVHPASLEETLSIAKDAILNMPKAYPNGDTPVLIGIDSLAGCVPEYEQEEVAITNANRPGGNHAKACAKFYRDIIGPLSYEKCVVVVLNQLRDKIGGMSFGPEPAEALIGGEAQRFHSTYQFKMALTKQLVAKDGFGAERKYGSRHKISCTRNKLGREGANQAIEFDMFIQGGIDWWTPLVRKVATDYSDLITDKGSNYFSWNTPETKYTNEAGEEVVIDIGSKFKSHDLAKIIKASTEAKELIRKHFTIPDLPSEAVVKAIDTERKQKRGKKKHDEEEETIKSL